MLTVCGLCGRSLTRPLTKRTITGSNPGSDLWQVVYTHVPLSSRILTALDPSPDCDSDFNKRLRISRVRRDSAFTGAIEILRSYPILSLQREILIERRMEGKRSRGIEIKNTATRRVEPLESGPARGQ